MRKKSLPANNLGVVIRHTGWWSNWDEYPGVEPWYVEALLGPDESATVVIATASFHRVDLQICTDFGLYLDCISRDLGEIASAINDTEDRLAEHSIIVGGNSSILIADDVVVDRFWRGNRLGPALVFFAADALRADGIFLTPVALGTRISASGVCFTDYEAPRPGLPAQKKVEAAWRRAGFRKLVNDVVWIPTWLDCSGNRPNHGALARERMRKIENLSNEPRAKTWLKRRIRRQTKSLAKITPAGLA